MDYFTYHHHEITDIAWLLGVDPAAAQRMIVSHLQDVPRDTREQYAYLELMSLVRASLRNK